MKKQGIHKAQIPNPALKELGQLIGEWTTAGIHPAFPNKVLAGKSFFEWIEGGAFLRWYSEGNVPGFSQRYSWTITDNGNTVIGKGELCEDGKTWKKDLDQVFTRVK